MLEIRNVTKIYRSKTGEEVRALDNVSIAFPESGMVFILGKSGSGKSTLLNVIGGLDSSDGGEFIIKGKSSKDFGGSDFDAYRNTYIGFIFQEYNILDDFSVGANIGLALELQGRKASDDKINEILAQVDLVNYAHRKPNELSGGQKQRVAIARALVKKPQIIMADEPTGALDSKTGKQIFDTLKELSREKLVLIVSHDRDFAERYADRIIEMADGRVASDVTKHHLESTRVSEGIQRINQNILSIKGGYQLTPADVKMINEYLRENSQNILLSGDKRVNEELRSAVGITEDGGTSVFESTDAAKDITIREYQGNETKFIHSRLPMKNAVRMGRSGLKHKKFRLVITIILSFLSFALFGLADTVAAYDKITAATESIIDSNIKAASFTLGVRRTSYYSDGDSYSYYNSDSMNADDIKALEERTGVKFIPVFNGSNSPVRATEFDDMLLAKDSESDVLSGKLYGFVSLKAEELSSFGMTLTGSLPAADDEIVITELTYRHFKEYGFKETKGGSTVRVSADKLTMNTDGDVNSIIGKYFTISVGNAGERDYKIVGVIDTGFEYDRYATFMPSDGHQVPDDAGFTDMILGMELKNTLNYGFHTMAFMTETEIKNLSEYAYFSQMTMGEYLHNMNVNVVLKSDGESEDEGDKGFYMGNSHYLYTVGGADLLSEVNVVYWTNGTPMTALQNNEMLLHINAIGNLANGIKLSVSPSALITKGEELYGTYWANFEGFMLSDRIRESFSAQYREANEGNYPTEEMIEAEYKKFQAVLEDVLGMTFSDTMPVSELYGLLNEMSGYLSEERGFLMGDYTYLRCRIKAREEIRAKKLYENQELLDGYMMNWSGGAMPEGWDGLDVESKVNYLFDFYYSYYVQNSEGNSVGDVQYSVEILEAVKAAGISFDSLVDVVAKAWTWDKDTGEGREEEVFKATDWKIVGFFDDSNARELIISEGMKASYYSYLQTSGNGYREEVTPHKSGIYAFALAPMPSDPALITKLVNLNYEENPGLKFELKNNVMDTLNMFNEFIEIGAQVFLYVGLGFAFFSALLLMNFISISISYKKRDIGILRAVGARSSDVFKIFFSEAFIIAMINYVLSLAALVASVVSLNTWMRGKGIKVTLLTVGIRQFVLMLLISAGVAALASFLPVWNIARKKPIDAIKDR